MPRWRAIVLRSLLVTVALTLLAGATYALIGDPLDPFDNRSFAPDAWKAAAPERRARMCRDVIARHVTPGMGEPQVVALLGEPDRVYEHGDGVRGHLYAIGNWSSDASGNSYLTVFVDQDGRVVRAEIEL